MKTIKLLSLVTVLALGSLSIPAHAGVTVSFGVGGGYVPYYGPCYGPPGAYYGPNGPLIYVGPGNYGWHHGYWHGGYVYHHGYYHH